MSIFARPALLAAVVFILAQFTLPGQASGADDGAGAVAEPVQLHHDAHPATYGARALPDATADRFGGAAFVAAQAAGVDTALPGAAAPGRRLVGAGTDALLLLPLARAPPALS
jgi:hypothetical protein